MFFVLSYTVVPDYSERRIPHRDAHLNHARQAVQRGELLLGGALANPIDAAILLFQCDSIDIVERFVQSDPYFQAGLIVYHTIREWTPVVGSVLDQIPQSQ